MSSNFWSWVKDIAVLLGIFLAVMTYEIVKEKRRKERYELICSVRLAALAEALDIAEGNEDHKTAADIRAMLEKEFP